MDMGLSDPIMPNQDVQARNYFLACYAVLLVQGQTVLGQPVRSRIVRNYLTAAYSLFDARSISYRPLLATDYINIVINTVQSYESVPNRQNMISDSMTRWLVAQAKKHHPDSAFSATVDWILLGHYTGFRK